MGVGRQTLQFRLYRGVPSAGGEASAIGSDAIHMKMHRAESAISGREPEEKEEGRACKRGRDMVFSSGVRSVCINGESQNGCRNRQFDDSHSLHSFSVLNIRR